MRRIRVEGGIGSGSRSVIPDIRASGPRVRSRGDGIGRMSKPNLTPRFRVDIGGQRSGGGGMPGGSWRSVGTEGGVGIRSGRDGLGIQFRGLGRLDPTPNPSGLNSSGKRNFVRRQRLQRFPSSFSGLVPPPSSCTSETSGPTWPVLLRRGFIRVLCSIPALIQSLKLAPTLRRNLLSIVIALLLPGFNLALSSSRTEFFGRIPSLRLRSRMFVLLTTLDLQHDPPACSHLAVLGNGVRSTETRVGC